MPVFFGRDISRFSEFISVWYGNSPTLRTPLKVHTMLRPSVRHELILLQAKVKILYPLDYLPTPNAAQSGLIDKFISGLESALQVTRTEISLAELWKGDCPDGAEHTDITEYLEFVCIWLISHASPLLTFRRLEFTLSITINTTASMILEINMQRDMGNLPSFIEHCISSSK